MQEAIQSAISEMFRVIRKGSLRFNSGVYDTFWYNGGEKIMQKDWDILIILDGCRYDLFEQVVRQNKNLEGTLEQVHSAGSSSREFIENNWKNKNFHDTVYISSNPHVANLDDGVFHAVYDLINKDDYWDDEKQVVLPSTMASKSIDISEKYPDKRLIIHFMQPHFPFIGSKGEI